MLLDVLGGDYRPSAFSPAIDSGDSTVVVPALDLDGLPRAFDDPATPDTGVGPAPAVDMGAYEFGSQPVNSAWVSLGPGLAGSAGLTPALSGSGALLGNDMASLSLGNACPVPAPFSSRVCRT